MALTPEEQRELDRLELEQLELEQLELEQLEAEQAAESASPGAQKKVLKPEELKAIMHRNRLHRGVAFSVDFSQREIATEALNALSGLSPYAPQILGAGKAFGMGVNAIPGYIEGKITGNEVKESPLDVAGRNYDETRDFYQAELDEAGKEAVKVFGLPVSKTAASLLLPGPGGAKMLPKLVQAALLGAYQTGATSPEDLGMGAGIAAGATGLLSGGAKLAGKGLEAVSKKSALAAFGAPTNAMLKGAGAKTPSEISALAEELRASGLIKPGGTAGDVLEEISKRLDVSGEDVEKAIELVEKEALASGKKIDFQKIGKAMSETLPPQGRLPAFDVKAKNIRALLGADAAAQVAKGEAGFKQGSEMLRNVGRQAYDRGEAAFADEWKNIYNAGRGELNKQAGEIASPAAKKALETANQGFSSLKKYEGLVRAPPTNPLAPNTVETAMALASGGAGPLAASQISSALRQRIPSLAMRPLQYAGQAATAFGESGIPMAAGRAAYAASAGKPKEERDQEAIDEFIKNSP